MEYLCAEYGFDFFCMTFDRSEIVFCLKNQKNVLFFFLVVCYKGVFSIIIYSSKGEK